MGQNLLRMVKGSPFYSNGCVVQPFERRATPDPAGSDLFINCSTMGNNFMDNGNGLERLSGNYDFVFNPAVRDYITYSQKTVRPMAWKVAYFLVTFFGIPGIILTMLADIGVFAMSNWKVNVFFVLSSIGVGLRLYWYNRDKVRNDKKERLQMKIMEHQIEIDNDEIKPHQ